MGLLGFNMLFAGFALFLNGVSYAVPFNRKALGLVNLIAAGFMAVNTLIGLAYAGLDMTNFLNYSNAAAGAAFALNFFVLGIHHLKEMTDFSLFGWFSLLMCLFSVANVIKTCVDAVIGALFSSLWIFIYLWSMWALLWGQAFLASGLKIKAVDKASPYIIIVNALSSLSVPAVLFLFGIL